MSSPEQGKRNVIKVRLLRAGKVIRTYKVRSDTFTIGSAKGCTMRAAGDTSVADLHATIYVEDGDLSLVPEPGALVHLNGEPVDFAAPGPTDIIKVGKLSFRVELAESMDSLAPPEGARPSSRAPATRKSPSLPPVKQSRAPVSPRSSVPSPVKRTLPPSIRSSIPVPDPTLSQELPRPERSSRPASKKGTGLGLMGLGTSRKEERGRPVAQTLLGGSPLVKSETPPPRTTPPPLKTEEEKRAEGVSVGMTPVGEGREDETTAKVSPTSEPEAPASPSDESVESTAPSEEAKGPPAPEESAHPVQTRGSFGPAFLPDEEDDDEFDFVEPFDLAAALLAPRAPQAGKVAKEPYLAAHIVRVREGRVKETFCVKPTNPFSSNTGELRCRMGKAGLTLTPMGEISGVLNIGGTETSLAEAHAAKLMLGEGDSAQLRGPGGIYSIEVYRPPKAPVTKGFTADRRFLIAIGVAFVIHVVVSVAVAYVQPKAKAEESKTDKETFAVVKMDKPEEPKQEELAVHEEAPANAQEIAERAPPRVTAKTINKRIRERSRSKPSASVSSLLQVLSRGSGKAGSSNKLKDLVSNIDAVASSGAGGSPFSIAGAIASLPGNGINIAKKGGGGAISTLSGEQVAGKGTGIATLAKSKRSGKVRGKVTKMSSGARVKGSLSMADVSRVVNSHTHALQACYEKALMGNPALSGRIAFDWTVTTSGKVKGVRVRSSTLGSPKVASCITALIKRWKFPRPKGGEVVITYPFLFRGVH